MSDGWNLILAVYTTHSILPLHLLDYVQWNPSIPDTLRTAWSVLRCPHFRGSFVYFLITLCIGPCIVSWQELLVMIKGESSFHGCMSLGRGSTVYNNIVVLTLSLLWPQLLQLATEEVNSLPSLTHRRSRVRYNTSNSCCGSHTKQEY